MKSSGQFLNGGTPSHIDQPIPLCCVIGKGGIYRRHPLVRTQVGDRFTLAGSAIEGPAMITALQPSFRTDAAERQRHPPLDRKSVVSGKSVSVRLVLGCLSLFKQK